MGAQGNTLTYAFRRPRFPVLGEFDGDLFAADSSAALKRHLLRLELIENRKARFVDANGEGWIFLPDLMVFAPGFPMRRWLKVEVIRMFNDSRFAREKELTYPEHWLKSRRFDAIVCEIAALLVHKRRKPRSGARRR